MNRIIFNLKLEYNGKIFEINNFNSKKAFLGCEYNVEKNSGDKISQSTFTLYNLPLQIRQYYSKNKDEQKDINIVFSVGNSEDNIISQVFTGKVSECISGGLITIQTSISAFPIADVKIYSQINLVKPTIRELKNVFATKLGLTLDNQAGDDDEKLEYDYNVVTQDILQTARQKFHNQNVVINNDKLVFTLKNGSAQNINNIKHIFTETNGLLDLKPNGEIIELENFLCSNVSIGDVVIVNKKVIADKSYNGTYLVTGLQHNGLISCVKAEANKSYFQLRKIR